MDNQKIFTASSKIYLELEEYIRKMYAYKSNHKNSLEEYLKEFDILIQRLILKTILMDKIVTKEETKFINYIVTEFDILKDLNKNYDLNLNWSNLVNITYLEQEKLMEELDALYKIKNEDFILFLASVDSYTNIDFSDIFYSKILDMLILLSKIDSNNLFDLERLKTIINETFMNKYIETKKIFTIDFKL